jgi:hypothetical protein
MVVEVEVAVVSGCVAHKGNHNDECRRDELGSARGGAVSTCMSDSSPGRMAVCRQHVWLMRIQNGEGFICEPTSLHPPRRFVPSLEHSPLSHVMLAPSASASVDDITHSVPQPGCQASIGCNSGFHNRCDAIPVSLLGSVAQLLHELAALPAHSKRNE